MKGVVDGTLVFGTPVLVFAMQAHMLGDTEFGLAYSAVAAALFYAVTATLLDRERSPPMRLLVESYLALAVAFATLAIPLALDARWTAAGWALEGAALVWIGVRQQRVLARLAGALLVFAAGVSFLDHGWKSLEGPPFVNGNLLGGWLIAVSALLSSRFLARVESRWQPLEKILGVALCAWGFLWWAGAGTIEIIERVPRRLAVGADHRFLSVVGAAADPARAAARLEGRGRREPGLAAAARIARGRSSPCSASTRSPTGDSPPGRSRSRSFTGCSGAMRRHCRR